MYILFIDTHYTRLQLVLFKDGVFYDERIKENGKHSEYLIPLLRDLFEKNKITFDELSGIIVVNGPGSFTGVRLGVVVAKMIGYNKHIPIKAISYLQAVALKYDQDVYLGIRDKNGVFVGHFDKNHECQGDYYYLTNQEFEQNEDKIIIDEKINLDMVYQYMANQKEVHPHLLKPIYVKKIEVET